MARKPMDRGALLVLGAALLWSTGGYAIKAVAVDGAEMAAARCLIAGLVFAPFIRLGRVRPTWKLAALLVSYPVMSVSFVLANKWTTAANAVAIQYTAPLWIFAGQAVMLRTRPTLRRVLPMLIVAAGIILFLMEPATGKTLKGNLTAILSGVAFALVIVSLRALRDQHTLTLVSFSNLVTALVLIPFLALSGRVRQFAELTPGGWIGLVYLGAVQIGLAYALYSAGLKRVTALKASMISLIEPALNPIWVWLLLSEVPTGYGAAGAGAILVGVAVDSWVNRGPEKEEERAGAGWKLE